MHIDRDKLSLEEIVGQERPKKLLALFSKTFDRRGRLPNLGVFGRSGMGKTALISAWCESLGAEVLETNGTSVESVLTLREFMHQAREAPEQHFMVFIDEAHALPKKTQTALLTMLEAPYVLTAIAPREIGYVETPEGRSIFIDKGDTIREAMPHNLSFALATTDPQKLLDTLLSRVRRVELDEYAESHLVEIATKHLPNAPEMHLCGLVRRMRSIRHLIDTLAETYQDIVDAEGEGNLQLLDELLGIDGEGATKNDIQYLEYLEVNGVSGVANLAGWLRKDPKDVEAKMEPFLMAKGWVARTRRGRELTPLGKMKLKGNSF